MNWPEPYNSPEAVLGEEPCLADCPFRHLSDVFKSTEGSVQLSTEECKTMGYLGNVR